MPNALPIAGVSVGGTLGFGTPAVVNSRKTVVPSDWASLNFGRNLVVYDPNQNGAAVWFNFEQGYTKPDPLNVPFDFSNDRLVFSYGWDSYTTGVSWVIGTPSFNPSGWDSSVFGVSRSYDAAAPSLDIDFVDVYVQVSPLNVPFTFGGASLVSGITFGDLLRISNVQVENTAKQFWPSGAEYLLFGKPRVSDQFDSNFIFTETYTVPSSASVRFVFSSVPSEELPVVEQGWDSCRFGDSTRTLLVDIAVNFIGRDFSSFGLLKAYDAGLNPDYVHGVDFNYVEQVKYPPALNVPFYFTWLNRLYAHSWNSSQFGNPEKVWKYHQWAYQEGSYYTQFGLSALENTAVPVYPSSSNFVEFGLVTVQSTGLPIEPAGIDALEFGAITVIGITYYVTTNVLLLPPLVSADVSYNASVSRPTVCRNEVVHQLADKFIGTIAQDKFKIPKNTVSGAVSVFQNASGMNIGLEHKLPDTVIPVRGGYVHWWLRGLPICNGVYSGQQDSTSILNKFESLSSNADRMSSNYLNKSPGMLVGSRQYVKDVFQQSSPFIIGYENFYDEAVEFETGSQMWWQEAVPPQPGVSFVPPEPPLPPKCYTPNPHLLFRELQEDVDAHLLFVCEYVAPPDPETVLGQVIPYRKVYIVMNSVELFKKDGMVELPVLSFGIDIDMDSWCWGFSCSVHHSALSHVGSVVANEPVELVARVNGEDFELLAESVSRNRSWESTSLSIQGRGKSAYLSTPYAPSLNFANTEPKTAQQLMVDALTYNGVSLGWGVTWDVEDWGVPSGVWSITGGYMEALLSVANACGAFILPHASQNILYVKPRYPAWPWAWSGVPNNQLIQIPSAVVETESIKWETKPSYNGVYVSGVSSGTLALVKKLGTAGDYLDTMVTDSLITSAAAARQRGGTILSQTGRMALVSLSLPILPETGIIRPGKLVKYVDNGTTIIGLVKSVSATMQGGPSLRQSIELEVHYG